MANLIKKLSHRNWEEHRDAWLEHLPDIGLPNEYPSPALWDLPEFATATSIATDETVVGYLSGVREAIFREFALFARKLSYFSAACSLAVRERKQTWSILAAYEACFFGAKAFVYLMGFASAGRDSKLYVDAFHRNVMGNRKYQRCLLEIKFHNLGQRLTHDVLWMIFRRLLFTARFTGDLVEVQTALRRIDWETFSRYRNKMLYNGGYWPFKDEMDYCDLCLNNIHPALTTFDRQESSFPIEGANDYFLAQLYLRQMNCLLLSDIAHFAPKLAIEVRALN